MKESQFFKDLDTVISVSSRERKVRNKLKEMADIYHCDVVYDNLGSTFLHLPSLKKGARKVLLSFPMDESGYMVSNINEDGTIHIVSVSDQTSINLLGKTVVLETRTGKQYTGYTSFDTNLQASTKQQLTLKEEDCKVYFGFESKAEVMRAGIKIGDTLVIKEDFKYQKPLVITRGLDVRIGLYITDKVLKTLKDKKLDYDLYIGGVVQEKVAYRGAVSTTTTIEPDINISLTLEAETSQYKLGNGIFIKSFDKTTLPNRWMYDFIIEHTNVHPHISDFGTSASFIHKSMRGVPSVVMGLHARNLGLNTMMCHEKDIVSLYHELETFLTIVTNKDIDTFKGSDYDV